MSPCRQKVQVMSSRSHSRYSFRSVMFGKSSQHHLTSSSTLCFRGMLTPLTVTQLFLTRQVINVIDIDSFQFLTTGNDTGHSSLERVVFVLESVIIFWRLPVSHNRRSLVLSVVGGATSLQQLRKSTHQATKRCQAGAKALDLSCNMGKGNVTSCATDFTIWNAGTLTCLEDKGMSEVCRPVKTNKANLEDVVVILEALFSLGTPIGRLDAPLKGSLPIAASLSAIDERTSSMLHLRRDSQPCRSPNSSMVSRQQPIITATGTDNCRRRRSARKELSFGTNETLEFDKNLPPCYTVDRSSNRWQSRALVQSDHRPRIPARYVCENKLSSQETAPRAPTRPLELCTASE